MHTLNEAFSTLSIRRRYESLVSAPRFSGWQRRLVVPLFPDESGALGLRRTLRKASRFKSGLRGFPLGRHRALLFRDSRSLS